MINAVNWFEIPVTNFDRAKNFYETILTTKITIHEAEMPGVKYGMFSYDLEKNGIGGAIIEADGQVPSMEGSTIYLNGGDDLSIPLSRVESAGGKVLMPKMAIGENGFIAQFVDTEGNRVAFHSMS